MRRFFDLVVAGSVLFLCLFFALILLSVSASSDSGLLTMLTGFLALIFGAIAGGFQLVFAGLRLIFKLDPRRFWARATLVSLAVTAGFLIYAALSDSAETGLLTLALGIFTILAALQFGCCQALGNPQPLNPATGKRTGSKKN